MLRLAVPETTKCEDVVALKHKAQDGLSNVPALVSNIQLKIQLMLTGIHSLLLEVPSHEL